MNAMKTIFFDMGNTLLHFHCGKSDEEKDLMGLKYMTAYLNEWNSSIKFEDLKRGFFDPWMKGIEHRKVTHTEYPIEGYLNDFLQPYGLHLTIEQCIEAIHLFYSEYRAEVYCEEDVGDTLKILRSKGYNIAVISNTCYYDEVMKECFKKTNIYDLFDHFTFSYSLRIAKPNPQIFQTALEAMKAKPQESVMVGDSLASDIKPALNLGMKTIWLNRKGNENKTTIQADFEITRLSELTECI